jgi:hypothetical protein
MKWKLQSEAGENEGSAPVVSEDVGAEGDSQIWDDLLDDGADEAAEVEGLEPEANPAAEVGGEAENAPAEVVEVVAPAPAVVEVAPVVEKPIEVVAQPPAPVVSQVPAESEQPKVTEEQRAYLRQQAMSALEARYKLPEEDVTALQMEPEKVLPKLAANLHAAVYEDVLRRVVEEMPALVNYTVSSTSKAREAEEAFYGQWENLRDHRAEVQKVGAMWRQMYPNATLAEAIKGIGEAASALLGLSAGATPPPAVPTQVIPPPPAGPSSRVGAVPPARSRLSTEEQSFVDLAKTFEEEF